MKIFNNPEENTMICELPNGVTVEIMQVSLCGSNFSADQDLKELVNVVKSLPSSILQGSQASIY
ncbi:MAG: hypothetical protein MK188_02825 [Gammaproteobacteria bacterium]|nr:hypothetical protein [Gammaproteobacteria bacterium]